MHLELTALIVYWVIAFAVVEVELVLLMLELIDRAVVIRLELMVADASNQDARIIHLAALFDNMRCLAYTGDKQLDKPLVCNSSIDMEANSTYHGDADHMRNTMADMWDSASDAAAVNNDWELVILTALATEVEELLVMILEVVDIGTNVMNLSNFNKKKINQF